MAFGWTLILTVREERLLIFLQLLPRTPTNRLLSAERPSTSPHNTTSSILTVITPFDRDPTHPPHRLTSTQPTFNSHLDSNFRRHNESLYQDPAVEVFVAARIKPFHGWHECAFMVKTDTLKGLGYLKTSAI